MIKVFYGKKGTGKTKHMLENANEIVVEAKGNVVYIDDSNEQLMKLAREIRFVNVMDYPVKGTDAFLGFICGIASQNYDIETIFIDGLNYIVGDAGLEAFFKGLETFEKQNNLGFFISINGDENNVPAFIKKFI
ncbi:MAG: hypothetical protein K6B54_02265 [Clostridia bacterium]|nr:hypothetical protein [Clostridia bacterium]MCR5055716.1 hypothetical protein [Clostridia bacterium]